MDILEASQYLMYILMHLSDECISDIELLIEETIPWESIDKAIEREEAKRRAN